MDFACERGLSKRRACGLIGVASSTLSYERRLPAKDAPVIAAMKSLFGQYPRYGYRRNGKFPDECLSRDWFRSRRAAA